MSIEVMSVSSQQLSRAEGLWLRPRPEAARSLPVAPEESDALERRSVPASSFTSWQAQAEVEHRLRTARRRRRLV